MAHVFKGHLTIRNPDAFPVDIHLTSRRSAGGFLWTSAREERTVEHRQFRLPGGIGNDDREKAGIFVIHVIEFDTLIRAKLRQPQTLPMEEILPILPRRSVGLGVKMPCRS